MRASEDNVRAALAAIDEQGVGDFVGRIEESVLVKAEERLGVLFPPGYRAFLAALGCGDIHGREFYGVIGEPLDAGPIPNAVWYALELRREGLDVHYVPVCEPGDGAIYVLDTRDEDENLLVWFPRSEHVVPVGMTVGDLLLESAQRGPR